MSGRFALPSAVCELQAILKQSTLNDCKNDLKYYKVGFTLMYTYVLTVPWSPKFHKFCSTNSHCQIIGNLQTSAPNDPKIALNPICRKYPISYM